MKPHEAARQWRKSLNLSVAALAKLSGYSEVTIYGMEWGRTPPRTAAHIAGPMKSKAIPERIWQRYRNVCGFVSAGKAFDWVVISNPMVSHE